MNESMRLPFNESMRAISGRDVAASLGPRPLAVVGARSGDEICFATVAWATPISHTPPMVAFALRRKSRTFQLVEETGHFTLNTPDQGMQDEVETCGNNSGNRVDKSELVEWSLLPIDGQDANGPAFPVLANALTAFECEVESISETGDHMLVVGSVENAWSHAGQDDRGRIDATEALLCVQHDVFAKAQIQ